jgi:hypothetical protein
MSSFKWKLVALCAVAVAGCRGDSAKPGRVADTTAAGQLVGAWQLTLRLERPLSLSVAGKQLPISVDGSVALLENRAGGLSFDQMSNPTHVGAYTIDLSALGFPPQQAGVVPGAAAQLTRPDSLFIVLNPEGPSRALRLRGTFDGERANGVWMAEALLGGGGTFTMQRGVREH